MWYEKTRFNLHLDHHATPENGPNLGLGLRKDRLRKLLRRMKPDVIQYHSMGHPGWALFRTRYGITCSTLKKDFLKIWAEVCKEEGIKFGFYYSSGYAKEVTKRHPEWVRKKTDRSFCEGWEDNGSPLCFNSDYVDKMMIPLLKELIEKYDASHFWLDGDIGAVRPCWCKWCLGKFKKKYGYTMPKDENNPDVIKFQFESYNDYLARIKREITSLKSDVLLCGNCAYTLNHGSFMEPSKDVDWLSIDIPFNLEGLQTAGVIASYMAILDKPFDLMVYDRCMPVFQKSTALPKSVGMLKAESATILSHGGRVFFWNDPNPDSSIYEMQLRRGSEVADFVRTLAPFTIGNKSIARTGILWTSRANYLKHHKYLMARNSIYSLGQMLEESMVPYDIFNEINLKRLSSKYNLIVLPEPAILEVETVNILKEYVSRGGRFIMLGIPDIIGNGSFIKEFCGFKLLDRTNSDIFLKIENEIFELKNCELSNVKILTAKVKQEGCKSLNDANRNGIPIVVKNNFGKGIVVTLTCGVTSIYFKERYPKYRDWVIQIIDRIAGKRQVYIETIYPLEVVLNERNGAIYLHLVNKNTGRANGQHVEDILPSFVKKVRVLLRERPTRVSTVPDKERLPFNYKDNYVNVRLNKEFRYYQGIRLEFRE